MNIDNNRKTSKKIWSYMWGESPLQELLKLNTKLKPLDKFLNITWLIFLVIATGTSLLSLRIPIYFVITIPILVLALCCIIILFRKGFGKQRFIYLVVTILMMILSQEWVDLPSYLRNDYSTAVGIPTQFDFHMPRSGPRHWEVVVDDVKFSMPETINEESSERWFVIRYLPHSRFIIDYNILTNEDQ